MKKGGFEEPGEQEGGFKPRPSSYVSNQDVGGCCTVITSNFMFGVGIRVLRRAWKARKWRHWQPLFLSQMLPFCPSCHPAQGTSLVGFPSSRPVMNIPYWGCSSKSLPQFSAVQLSRSVVSDSLRPYELQHARPPCPSPSPGVHSNSRPLSR